MRVKSAYATNKFIAIEFIKQKEFDSGILATDENEENLVRITSIGSEVPADKFSVGSITIIKRNSLVKINLPNGKEIGFVNYIDVLGVYDYN